MRDAGTFTSDGKAAGSTTGYVAGSTEITGSGSINGTTPTPGMLKTPEQALDTVWY